MYQKMFVSLIYACYNEYETLIKVKDHLDDLSSYHWLEIIISDGGSSDGTLDLIDNDRIIITSEKDTGIYDAWNRGLSLAKGEYIAFLGLSDRISLEFLVEAKSILKEGLLFIYGNAIREFEGKKRIVKTSKTPCLFDPKKKLKKFDFVHQGCLNHRSLFIDSLFRIDLRLSSDLEFYLRKGNIIYGRFKKLNIIQAVVQYDGISTTLHGVRLYKIEKEILEIEYPEVDFKYNKWVYLFSNFMPEKWWYYLRVIKWKLSYL